MKPVDVKSNTDTDFNQENDKEDPTFEAGYHVTSKRLRFKLVRKSFYD